MNSQKSIITILLLAVVLLTSGCSRSSEEQVELDELSFTSPAGWTYQLVESEDEVVNLLIRKRGMFSSGFVNIILKEGENDRVEMLDNHRSRLNEQEAFTLTDDNFALNGDTTYGAYKAAAAEFSQIYFGAGYRGNLYAISEGGISVHIMEAGNEVDADQNEIGFQTIRESLILHPLR